MINLRNNCDIGSMRSLVTIQEPSSTGDAFGKEPNATTWNDVHTTWASINMQSQRQAFNGGQVTSDVTHAIVIRYTDKTIKGGMRVVFMGKYYAIHAASDPDGRRTTIKILAQEVTS